MTRAQPQASVLSRRGPGRPAARGRDAAVREKLLDAATSFAIERGLDGASIRDIADRAGVSSAMISYYFGDRRGLHEAMFQRAITTMATQFEAALEHPDDGLDTLDTLFRIHATAMAANPWLPRLIAREVLGSETDFRERFQELVGEHPLRLLKDVVGRAVEEGRIRADLDPVLCVITILSLTAFPFLSGPLIEGPLGIEMDDAFRDRLIAHNREIIARGLRAPASEERQA